MSTKAAQPAHKQALRRISSVQQARLGIEVLDGPRVVVRCVTCGQTWYPELTSTGTIDPLGLICPRKCNL
jgi:hypothetical protein